MDCSYFSEIKEISSKQFEKNFIDKAISRRIPIGGGIELTYRCNLQCIHCYCICNKKDNHDMSYDEICKIIDQLSDAGCLYLFITGGEPLLRNDFPDIYKYIKKKGILVTVFTNGTLVSDDLINLFLDFPPFNIDITMYGASQEIYEAVTQVKGSYNLCMDCLEMLLKHKIHFSLKTIVMRYNQNELGKLKTVASKLGVNFRYSSLIFPRLDDKIDTYKLRLSPKEVVNYDIGDNQRKHAWLELLSDSSPPFNSEFLYLCGAALTTFHIDAEGYLCACVRERKHRYSLLNGSFQYGWNNFLYNNIRMRRASSNYKCSKCKYIMVCDQCPAIFESENGNPEESSEYICEIAHIRAKKLGLH